MFSKFLVNIPPKLHFFAQNAKIATSPSKLFISSLFADKKSINPANYHIQLMKSSEVNPALNFLEKNYFTEEPLCKSLNLGGKKLEGPVENLIKDGVKQGMTLIARENSKENEIIGICINSRSCPWDADKLIEYAKNTNCANTRKLLHIWALLAREPKLHQELSQSCIFDLAILAVKKSHQGQGLGSDLTRRSLELGRDLNYTYARIDCTSDFMMRIAERLQMTRLWDVPYKNILLQDGKKPLAVPEFPHSHAASYYANLKQA